ncbi:MAG: polysaccharide deacetylase family protein [Sporichthyaceae bacterium]
MTAVVAGLGYVVVAGAVAAAPSAAEVSTAPAAERPWELVAHEVSGEPSPPERAAPEELARPIAEGLSQIDCRVERCVALTFDDGPSEHTERLLGMLREAEVPATFFVLGSRVRQFAETTRAAAELGEVASHGWDHAALPGLTDSQFAEQVHRTDGEIAAAVGGRPSLFRPPYGAVDSSVAEALRSMGLPIALWSVDPQDWRDRDADVVHRRVVDAVRPGSVVLLHDLYSSTVDAVQRIVADLRAQGYVFVTMSRMWDGKFAPGVAHTGREADWQGPAGPVE